MADPFGRLLKFLKVTRVFYDVWCWCFQVQYRSSQANIVAVQKVIDSSQTQQTTLLDLRKFVWYEVQVLAYTRIGSGVLSSPPVEARTHEDGMYTMRISPFNQ